MQMNIEGHNLRKAVKLVCEHVYEQTNKFSDPPLAKVEAIKLLKALYPLGLREAKDLIEAEVADRNPQPNNLDRTLRSQGYTT